LLPPLPSARDRSLSSGCSYRCRIKPDTERRDFFYRLTYSTIHKSYADNGMRDCSGNNVEAMLSAVLRGVTRETRCALAKSGKEERNSDPSGALSLVATGYLVCGFPPGR
jgi:hypothetical protein